MIADVQMLCHREFLYSPQMKATFFLIKLLENLLADQETYSIPPSPLPDSNLVEHLTTFQCGQLQLVNIEN